TQRLRSKFPIPEFVIGFPTLLRRAGYYCTNNVKTDYNTANEAEIIKASWDECSRKAHWRSRKPGQPFFAVFNDMTTHQSRTMVWPYEQFRREVQSRLSPDEIHDPAQAPIPPYYPDTPVVRRTVARYYDCVTVMDQNVGRLLKQLEEDGLADDTIVFFYSDHGSGMPRHKRALLDTGLHVPLMIRFPKKYQHLAPAGPGQTIDRLVSFVDFAPTVLSLCGLPIPKHMQGVAFLGAQAGPPRRFVFGARDRVDEVFDLARSVRNRRYLYIRNYMPHLSYHQPSAWPDQGEIRREITRFAREHPDKLTSAQRHYVAPTRPLEELYDVQADPLNLNNLADSPAHQAVLTQMREELSRWMRETRDLGFLPEAEVWRRCKGTTPYQIAQDPKLYPQRRLIAAASMVGDPEVSSAELTKVLTDDDAAVRYWGAVAFAASPAKTLQQRATLVDALGDSSLTVRIEAANALARAGEIQPALPVLIQCLESDSKAAVLHAARTIELLGEKARAAVPAMQAALERAKGPGEENLFIRFAAEAFVTAMRQ
ncbi:MAG: sulfatase-like hydrolase/transferase, partial [Planctomycetes bacterium]|nr:sulfatase-like hydrolase/transferase [Planctomycetota bacterium]